MKVSLPIYFFDERVGRKRKADLSNKDYEDSVAVAESGEK
jgi:hypothetical protein